MKSPEVGQLWKGKYHHKAVRLLEDKGTKWLVELVVSGGGGNQWLLGKETLANSYKPLEDYEETPSHLTVLPGGGAKLNIP